MTRRITSRGLDIVRGNGERRFLFWLGAYGWTRCLVFASDECGALEALGEWCAEHAPGLLCDDDVAEEAVRLMAEEGASEEDAWERAEVDTVRDGCGHYWHAWEMSFEEPSRERLLSLEER